MPPKEEQLRKRGFLVFLAVLAVGLSVVLTGCGGDDGGGWKHAEDRLRPAAAGLGPRADHADGPCDPVRPQAGRQQGRRLQRRVRVVRRLDCGRRQVGRGEVRRERAQLRRRRPIVGVIGTYNSGCAAIIIPILNEVPLAMVSPANTYQGLTKGGPGTETGEPDKYYPSGDTNYVRVVASDDNQGRIGAQYMKDAWASRRSTSSTTRSSTGRASPTSSRPRPRTSASASPAMRAGTRTPRTTRP